MRLGSEEFDRLIGYATGESVATGDFAISVEIECAPEDSVRRGA
jgi:hypothetical protein